MMVRIVLMKMVVGLATAALLLSGCAALTDPDADHIQVAAGFYPLAYVVERVGGERYAVSTLTQPGGEPHDLELGVRETAEIAQAALVVHLAGFQPAVDEAIEQTYEGDTLEAGEIVGLEPAAEGHEHAEDEKDDHGDLDPHFWLDPLRMATLGDAVAEQLSKADPENAEHYAANADALRADLEDLDAAYADGLADCERTTIVVSHDAFGYLSKYGLAMEPIAGLSPGAEPVPADLAHLQEVIAEDGITTVFSERLASPRLTESLAGDLGISTAVLDPIEGLSDETADEDYLSLMRANLAALQQANGCAR